MAEANPVDAVAAAVRSARRATLLALIAVLVAVVVLAIDNGIKREIIAEALGARRTLDEFKQLVRDTVVVSYGPGTGQDTAGGGPGPDVAGHVDDAPGVPAETDSHADRPRTPAGKRPGRPRTGTGGDGKRT